MYQPPQEPNKNLSPWEKPAEGQQAQRPMTDQERQNQKGFYEGISGGERWADLSTKRKVWIVIFAIWALLTIIILPIQTANQTDYYGNHTGNPGGAFFGALIVWGVVFLYILVIYPRRRAKRAGTYQFRPLNQPRSPQPQNVAAPSISALQTSKTSQVVAPAKTDATGRAIQPLPAWMLKPEEKEPIALAATATPSALAEPQATIPQQAEGTELPEEDTTPTPPRVQAVKPKEKETNVTVIGKTIEQGEIVSIPQSIRKQGAYIIGVNGTGKSTLIANMIAQDMEQGFGLCLLDPHGDITADVLSCVPENRVMDVILLDLMDSSYPFGLNLFDCPDPNDLEQVALSASFVMHVFEKVWNVGRETPLLSQVLRNVTFTLIQNPGSTFAEIPLILMDGDCREKLTGNVKNTQVRLFWQNYTKLKPHDQMERTSSTLNKVDAFLTQPIIANIVSQGKTTLNFREIMDTGKILLVQLNPRLEDISSLVGAVIIGQILNSALSRKDIPEQNRRQFNLYADEYQRFATEDFAILLSEARKFGVATTIAHQTRSQLDFANRGSSLNAATKIVFRVTGEDGVEVAKEFDSTPPPPDVIGQRPILVPKQDALQHLLVQGHPNPQAMAFSWYAQIIQDYTGEKLDAPHYARNYEGGMISGGITYMRNRNAARQYQEARELQAEAKQMLHDINAWFYIGMQKLDDTLELPHTILLTASQIAFFDKMLRPFNSHPREVQLLCSGDPNDWEKAKQTLVRVGNKDQEDQWQRCIDFLNALWVTYATLLEEPILVDSGRHEPIYDKPRTYADVQNEIATRLANLKNHTAKVKTISGEYNIQTLPATIGITNIALSERRQAVIDLTRARYCRPRGEVEEEVATRQEVLMRPQSEEKR